jgi:hypothetical protein
MMTLDNIVPWLRANGYDGLYSTAEDCSCGVEDLCRCGEIPKDCYPGVRAPCSCVPNGKAHDYHIISRVKGE